MINQVIQQPQKKKSQKKVLHGVHLFFYKKWHILLESSSIDESNHVDKRNSIEAILVNEEEFIVNHQRNIGIQSDGEDTIERREESVFERNNDNASKRQI